MRHPPSEAFCINAARNVLGGNLVMKREGSATYAAITTSIGTPSSTG